MAKMISPVWRKLIALYYTTSRSPRVRALYKIGKEVVWWSIQFAKLVMMLTGPE